jgi:hypothetical protein
MASLDGEGVAHWCSSVKAYSCRPHRRIPGVPVPGSDDRPRRTADRVGVRGSPERSPPRGGLQPAGQTQLVERGRTGPATCGRARPPGAGVGRRSRPFSRSGRGRCGRSVGVTPSACPRPRPIGAAVSANEHVRRHREVPQRFRYARCVRSLPVPLDEPAGCGPSPLEYRARRPTRMCRPGSRCRRVCAAGARCADPSSPAGRTLAGRDLCAGRSGSGGC